MCALFTSTECNTDLSVYINTHLYIHMYMCIHLALKKNVTRLKYKTKKRKKNGERISPYINRTNTLQ